MTKIALEAIKVLFVKKACNVVFHRGDIDGKALPKPGVRKKYKIRGGGGSNLLHTMPLLFLFTSSLLLNYIKLCSDRQLD